MLLFLVHYFAMLLANDVSYDRQAVTNLLRTHSNTSQTGNIIISDFIYKSLSRLQKTFPGAKEVCFIWLQKN